MEEENRYQEALETAKEIDVVENVMIRTVTTQMAFSSMMGGLERGDYVIPDFQRMYRWSESQAEELAVSLVRGMPIPVKKLLWNTFLMRTGSQNIKRCWNSFWTVWKG